MKHKIQKFCSIMYNNYTKTIVYKLDLKISILLLILYLPIQFTVSLSAPLMLESPS